MVKESVYIVGDLGSIPGLGRSPWRRESLSLQYSGLENSTDWIVHGVTKSRTQLSNFNLICSLRYFSDCLHSHNSCVVSLLLGVLFSQIHTDVIEKNMVYSFMGKMLRLKVVWEPLQSGYFFPTLKRFVEITQRLVISSGSGCVKSFQSCPTALSPHSAYV